MLEWEEGTFLGIKALYQRAITRPRERLAASVRIELKDHRQRLFLLTHLIAEKPIRIFETNERVLCDSDQVFLPSEMSLGRDKKSNAEFYTLKAMLAGLAMKNQWQPGPAPEGWEKTAPGIARYFANAQLSFEAVDLWGLIGTVRSTHSDTDGGTYLPLGKEKEEENSEEDHLLTEIQGKGQLDVEVELDTGDDGEGADMPVHTFEKTETLEEHTGLSRRSDDEDELEEHEEALKEVTMNRVFRSRERPQSIYRADALFNAQFFEESKTEAKGIPYPEWDYKRRVFRDNWCYVQETNSEYGNAEWGVVTESKHKALILDLKKKVAHIATETLRTKRQPIGSEFDIDALVMREVDLRNRRTPDDNLYVDRRRRLHDVTALILMDRSFSTDGYLNGKRVLDIIRETIFCVGEVLDVFIEDFSIATFSSNTRQNCSFDWVKTFEEPWMSTRNRLGSLQANGYTRMGPALRHAHEVLINRPTERKVTILVTDGRPCDYDRYEGTYGIRDIKHAIETGKKHGITTHAFAVEERAKEFFPAMFTPSHFHIIPKPEALTDSLCNLFVKLRAHE